jgi:chemotaxis protein MotB
MADRDAPEIIVRKKFIKPEEHGGSAWKVAYADFVTAMMAFFLLLWLLNATTEDQKQGLSNYFEPVGATSGSTGSGGVLGGISATDPGPIDAPGQSQSKTIKVRSQLVNVDRNDESTGDPAKIAKTPSRIPMSKDTVDTPQFKAAQSAIRRALEQIPELIQLFDSVSLATTEKGMRIRLMDRERYPLFDRSGTNLNENGEKLIRLVAEVIERLPNKILISGHTTPNDEKTIDGLSNWKISMERAYAARRMLIALGTRPQRITGVRADADRQHLVPEKPNSALNRRVEITLLRIRRTADPKTLLPPSLSEKR